LLLQSFPEHFSVFTPAFKMLPFANGWLLAVLFSTFPVVSDPGTELSVVGQGNSTCKMPSY
jgi:hypothetical protein